MGIWQNKFVYCFKDKETMIGIIKINLCNIQKNWLFLNKLSDKNTETGAVIKANAYGLGANEIALALWEIGNKSFFVATLEEAIQINEILPKKRKIYILNGYNKSYKTAFCEFNFIPVLNSPLQLTSFIENHPNAYSCIQVDIGMRRLGFQLNQLKKYDAEIKKLNLDLILGHLSSAIDNDEITNNLQLELFRKETAKFPHVRKSLAASHGVFLGKDYYFDLIRPGIALFGGIKNANIHNVISIELPIIQTHFLNPGEGVGYGLTYISKERKKIATLSGGYADGLTRNLSNIGCLYDDKIPCPILGKISMDLVTVDISHLNKVPDRLTFIGPQQTINNLSEKTKTVAHEILINLGNRFSKKYIEYKRKI